MHPKQAVFDRVHASMHSQLLILFPSSLDNGAGAHVEHLPLYVEFHQPGGTAMRKSRQNRLQSIQRICTRDILVVFKRPTYSWNSWNYLRHARMHTCTHRDRRAFAVPPVWSVADKANTVAHQLRRGRDAHAPDDVHRTRLGAPLASHIVPPHSVTLSNRPSRSLPRKWCTAHLATRASSSSTLSSCTCLLRVSRMSDILAQGGAAHHQFHRRAKWNPVHCS
jgi:hypothetical protein